jgi:hypothetical protein
MPNQINQSTPDQMQDGAVAAGTAKPGEARMAAKPASPKAGERAMPEAPKAARPPAGAAVMQPYSAPATTPAPGDAQPKGEMKSHPDVAGPAPMRESYVVLRVRAAGDRMTILGAQEVDGPLTLPSTMIGEHAYEALLDSRPIAQEGVVDVGISRSFPRPGEHEHHITERPSFDFNVRIPRSAVPDDALHRVALTLFRLPDASQKNVEGRLSALFGARARTVAHLDALRPEVFEPAAREQIFRLFPSFAAQAGPG